MPVFTLELAPIVAQRIWFCIFPTREGAKMCTFELIPMNGSVVVIRTKEDKSDY